MVILGLFFVNSLQICTVCCWLAALADPWKHNFNVIGAEDLLDTGLGLVLEHAENDKTRKVATNKDPIFLNFIYYPPLKLRARVR
jgi:hypothetical protein